MASGGEIAAESDTRQRVLNALARNKLIEGLVHKQAMRQHDRVETLVHKQNVSELNKLVLPLPEREIGTLLSELEAADRLTIWRLLPAERADAILLWLDDDLREWLVGKTAYHAASQRVSAFALVDGRFVQWTIDGATSLRRHPPCGSI